MVGLILSYSSESYRLLGLYAIKDLNSITNTNLENTNIVDVINYWFNKNYIDDINFLDKEKTTYVIHMDFDNNHISYSKHRIDSIDIVF